MADSRLVTNAHGTYSSATARTSRRNQQSGVWEDYVKQWAWGDGGDGSWFAVMTDDRLEACDNHKFFPTAWEAQRYAELRAAGFLAAGALIVLMEERVDQARVQAAK